MGEHENSGEAIAEDVTSAIENAQAEAEAARETAEAIAAGAMEHSRSIEHGNLKEELAQCREQINQMGELQASMALAMAELRGAQEQLTRAQLAPQPEPPTLQKEVEDAPQEAETVIAPEAAPGEIVQEVVPDEPAPRKKQRWI